MYKTLSIVFTIIILISSVLLINKDLDRRVVKSDYVEVSKAKYGIFNVDIWKVKVAEIVANKIDEFQFDPKNKNELIEKIESFLYQGVEYLEITIKSQQYSSVRGFLKNAFASGLDVFDDIKANVPALARSIVEDLEKPETRAKIKTFVKLKIDEYADETFAKVDYTELNQILLKYEVSDINLAKTRLEERYSEQTASTQLHKLTIYLGTLGLVICLFLSGGTPLELASALIACLALLFLGLFLPMIDIDARISTFDLVVLGEHIDFQDQVLYFKSKSILEVVGLMMSQSKIDIVIVGLLVLSFSVLFPAAKIVSSFSYLVSKRERVPSHVDFFVFKSGKWSMADVLVVAIFMSYIGFSSILSEQLGQLEKISNSLQVLTTNNSELNTGFFMFFGFVCLSLVIADRIRKHKK